MPEDAIIIPSPAQNTRQPKPRLSHSPYKANNILYTLRNVYGLTQAQLAEQAGVTRRTIIAIENQQTNPSVTVALAIAAALNIRVEDIFKLHDRTRPYAPKA